MSLHKWQIEEIAAFDWKKRAVHDFDGRRYGSVTGRKAPHFTEAWCPCHVSDLYYGKKRPTRKTLRYNYIVVGDGSRTLAEVFADDAAEKPPQWGKLEVTVVHVAVRLNGAYRQVVKEVGRWHIKTGKLELRDIEYQGLGGWIVDWQKEDWAGGANRKATKAARSETGLLIGKPVDGRWWNGGKWKFNMGRTFPWHETVNPDTLKGTRYEYGQYADGLPCKAGLVDWLMMYRQEPKIELLAKMGLYNLICPSGIKALKDKKIRDWIIAHREAIAKVANGVKDITYAARHNVTLEYAEKRQRLINDIRWRTRYWNDRVKVKLDYDRLMKTLPKWHVSVEEYVRYLEYAHEGGLDLRNEGTLYPPTRGGRKAFMERLEQLEASLARLKKNAKAKAWRQLARMMKLRAVEIAAFQESVERSKAIKSCGYTLILAKTQEELLAEGKKMHNCVGCGTYGRGIVEGDRLIVMLKRQSGRGYESFCDIEIDRKSWLVRQCYLKHNKRAPNELYELAKQIAAWFKAEHRRHQKRKMFKELERKAA